MATPLETLLLTGEILNPGGVEQISEFIDPEIFEATRTALKADPLAASLVEFFDEDPISFRIRGINYFAERPDADA